MNFYKNSLNSLSVLLGLIFLILFTSNLSALDGLPLYYYREKNLNNFGDDLSLKIVERMVNGPVKVYTKRPKIQEKKLLALGSIFYFAATDDVIWGTGINGKTLKKSHYTFTDLDVRAVRGPLTRQFLKDKFNIDSPEIYGDPALLLPYLFPEFKKKEKPSRKYLILPHYRDIPLFPKGLYENIVYATEPWKEIIEKILDSELVISSSLHGIIVAEAFGVPARMLRYPKGEFLFKYQDYYLGTGRSSFQYAQTVEEALSLGGEPPIEGNFQKLYEAFPFDYWPNAKPNNPFTALP